MHFSSNADSCCSRLSSLEHVFTQIAPHKRGSGIRSWAPFFVFSAPGNPPPSPHSLSFGGIGIVKTCTKKSKKQGFPKQILPLHPVQRPPFDFHTPHAIPMKISHKIGAGRVESPAFLKKIKPVLEKLLSNAAELDVCPGKCRKWSMAGEHPLPFRCRIFSG